MAEHEPGSMDTTEQEKTFDGFIKISTWVAAICVVILIFLAIVGT
ncbi:aa3-type cytochrome c oxidase subunit IV [Rhodobacteraceae bacterium NNCM2]|nr:aa3-type cytochrome c oxidase subunit IV [Coraliihabitans acroporae]